MTDEPCAPDPLAPGLYVAATPIGNLRDASPRLLDVLSRADLVLCEDSRVTGKLLSAFGVKARMLAYHDHNGDRVRPQVLERLGRGESLALVSDAGTPLVSDPGYKLVREARAAGHRVNAVPGPCAPIAALMVCGAPTAAFSFHGFLPRTDKARADALAPFRDRDETVLFFETAPRLASALAAVAKVLGARSVSVCRELTKLHEEVVTGDAGELAAAYEAAPPRGEIVLVIHPPAPTDAPAQADVDALLRAALGEHRVKDAAGIVAEATGLPRKALYARALELKDD